MEVKRGDIFMVNLGGNKGSIQGGSRPVVVVQNDIANKFAPILIVSPLTTSHSKKQLPTHVKVGLDSGLKQESTILSEQIITINKTDVMFKIGNIGTEVTEELNKALIVSLGMYGMFQSNRLT